MKVLFVISSLSVPGGAERVMSIMANHWAKKGWKITIVTFDHAAARPYYDLRADIDYLALSAVKESTNFINAVLNNSSRVMKLRRLIKNHRPQVIISFLTSVNIITLLAALMINVPVLVSERNNPPSVFVHPARRLLRKLLYPRAKAVVCQTRAMQDSFPEYVNSVVIPNPVQRDCFNDQDEKIRLPDGKLLFAVGSMSERKVYQKGFDLLIPVFSELAKIHEDWTLIILGEGARRQFLKDKVHELGLSDRIILPGATNNIQAVLSKGELFVLSSRYEGFPNALCEAMACGLAAVSFDCPTGPAEIIRDGIDGLLVERENTGELYSALNQMMSDEVMRDKMSIKAQEIIDRYSIAKVMNLWEGLLE